MVHRRMVQDSGGRREALRMAHGWPRTATARTSPRLLTSSIVVLTGSIAVLTPLPGESTPVRKFYSVLTRAGIFFASLFTVKSSGCEQRPMATTRTSPRLEVLGIQPRVG